MEPKAELAAVVASISMLTARSSPPRVTDTRWAAARRAAYVWTIDTSWACSDATDAGGEIAFRSVGGAVTGELLHHLDEAVPKERFAAGEANFLNPARDHEGHEALDFLKAEQGGAGDPLLGDGRRVGHARPVAAIEILRRLRFRQAIHAAEIASIGNAHPQVAQDAAMRIHEQIGRSHFTGGFVGAALVGETTRTVPSEFTSTFRS